MYSKTASTILLASLFVALVFVAGVGRAKEVQKARHSHKGCGLSFSYPADWQIQESSTGVSLESKNKVQLSINCDQALRLMPHHPSSPTAEITFKAKKIIAHLTHDRNHYDFGFSHPRNGKFMHVLVSKTFYPLFESSLEFSP